MTAAVAGEQIVDPPKKGVRWLALIAAMLGTTVYMMTVTTSGTAIPHMQGAFSAAPDQMAWLFTAFIIGTTIMTACSGWLAVRFGRRNFYLASAIGFTVSSTLCGFSESLEQAVLFRTLQGISGAPLIPLGQAIAIDAFPPNRQGQATTLWSIGGMWGSIFGPILGGALVNNYGWPWVFFICVPFGVAAALATWAFVPHGRDVEKRNFNWFGFAIISIAIAAFETMLNRGERLDWFSSPEIVIEGIVAAMAFYIFVVHTVTARTPFFDRGLFQDRNYLIALAFIFVYGSVVFLQILLIPLLLQDLAGYDIEQVGTLLTIRGLGVAAGMFMLIPFSDRIDPRLILLFGFGCLIVSSWGMSGSSLDIRTFDVAWTNFVQGIGSGVAYVPIVIFGFSTLPQRLRNEGVALLYLVSNIGTATGTAFIFNYLSRNMQVNQGIISEYMSPYSEMFKLGLVPRLWDWTERSGLAAMDAVIARQAAIIAYNSSFFLIALTALAVLPFALFVRLPPRAKG